MGPFCDIGPEAKTAVFSVPTLRISSVVSQGDFFGDPEKPWGGWVCSQIWENFPKKSIFLGGGLPLAKMLKKNMKISEAQ